MRAFNLISARRSRQYRPTASINTAAIIIPPMRIIQSLIDNCSIG